MITLILGGSGSGKSEYAEGYVVSRGELPRYYIATMVPYDKECEKKIARHRAMRKEKGFTTIEQYTHMENIHFPKKGVVLLECMSNLLANEMYQEEGRKEETDEVILKGIKELALKTEELVIVSNDVFLEGGTYDEYTKQYVKTLASINCKIAEVADHVIEVVYGIPIMQKGGSV